MKKILVLFLVLACFAVNCTTINAPELQENLRLKSGQKGGPEITIWKKDGLYEKGELIAVKRKSLLLIDYYSGKDISVEVDEIKTLAIARKSKLFLYMGLGLIPGVLSMAAGSEDRSEYTLNLGVSIGVVGLLLGTITGIVSGMDETIQIEGKSEVEIAEELEKLRKKARIPDYN